MNETVNYECFEDWLVSVGKDWDSYMRGDIADKSKTHRGYAIYLDSVELNECYKNKMRELGKEQCNKLA